MRGVRVPLAHLDELGHLAIRILATVAEHLIEGAHFLRDGLEFLDRHDNGGELADPAVEPGELGLAGGLHVGSDRVALCAQLVVRGL